MKRFSVKELRQWIMETATEAIQGDSFKTGTVFYKTLPGGGICRDFMERIR